MTNKEKATIIVLGPVIIILAAVVFPITRGAIAVMGVTFVVMLLLNLAIRLVERMLDSIDRRRNK